MAPAFTRQKLSEFNGLNGKPAYVGYKGKVYDVTNVFQNGEHGGIKAGQDLTGIFGQSPHQENIFNKFPVVGSLADETGFWGKIWQVSPQRADLLIRLALGVVFFAHGSQKLLGWFGGYGWSATIGFFTQSVGVPEFLAALVILGEFLGGIAIILGFFTRPAALVLSLIMLGAMFKVHLENGFFLDLNGPKDGVEYTLVLFLVAAYLAVRGAGKLSLDRFMACR